MLEKRDKLGDPEQHGMMQNGGVGTLPLLDLATYVMVEMALLGLQRCRNG